jgi:hypothetical protein
MLPIALFLAVHTSQGEVKTWYGPETATFPFVFAGNPYDPATADIKVQFIDGKGKRIERLAYFDQDEMAWKAVLIADQPGKYKPVMFRNGTEVEAESEPALVELNSRAIPGGFVQVDSANKTRFRMDGGKPFIPLGFNLGWQTDSLPDMTAMLATMGQNGINWTRIWASHWDGKNPWMSPEGKGDGDLMLPSTFSRWDKLVDAAEDAGVKVQFVLFHHGLFSTKTDSNWDIHPWNKANGGFLESPSDFFANEEAKRRSKIWLRYAVARWGHSPAIMAWELFNEVEWTDARAENKWADVLAWHREMAEYLRSLDPFRRPVTTSSTFDPPDLYEAMDFYQPHAYPPDISAALSGTSLPTDKPLFYGEIGPQDLEKPGQAMAVRNSIWSSLLSGHSGTAGYWRWETIHKEALYGEYKVARKILDETEFASRAAARPAKIRATTGAPVTTHSIREASWLMARVSTAAKSVKLGALALPSGRYTLTVYDLTKGMSDTKTIEVRSLDHEEVVEMPGSDAIVVFAPG